MRIYKLSSGDVAVEKEEKFYYLKGKNWDDLINRSELYKHIHEEISQLSAGDVIDPSQIVAPIASQEVWAAGVTYLRSKEARMDEAKASGGDVFYNKVYDADRPELFFKATAQRVVGTGQSVNIRRDSGWDVPEPELTLLINSNGEIQGYTIGNDMSSRSIEGENPLYLPQAKVFEKCAGLGPSIYLSEGPISPKTEIKIEISRGDEVMYSDKVAISMMKRTHIELAGFLFRECDFPKGVFLMTGTCLVPDDDFTLKVGDKVAITIEPVGTLVNHVSMKN
ncbi:fumarylacetoacetate hydrolase family protein [Flagellimonas onchidii]|uniref:fumarylacetoacetate hydrolase family protein n=1 Tax=Flagellimonas onchidii TaxID=2562684 RepID=UPI0010A60397|nr:fumarylacetoacetate hydrolase family protein [Allomuricauda onchidii]